MGKISVAILFGGRSVEHGVSVNSARNIAQYIDRKKFNIVPIGITQQGVWYLTKEVNKDIQKGKPLKVSLDPSRPHLLVGTKKLKFDIAFPVLHGTDGEDGSIQGLLKSLSIPIVGTSVLGSALAMNKIVAKKLLQQAGIPVTAFTTSLVSDKTQPVYEDLVKQLGLPFMVKAASLGSSVGVSKVNSKEEFQKAVKESYRYDREVLYERYIKGREIECAILGNDPPLASLPGEIIIDKSYAFYTFDAKYVDSKAVTIQVPAVLHEDQSAKIRELSVKAFQALKCEDYARVDLFLAGDEVFVNEINTIPGFTNSSMYPMMWKERGLSFKALISKLIALAMKRYKTSIRIQRQFSSSLKY